MKMNIKFKNKKSYDVCHTFINGNGFCFRPVENELLFEFSYVYAMVEVIAMCVGMLGINERDFKVIHE
jgi:hypothetical protein